MTEEDRKTLADAEKARQLLVTAVDSLEEAVELSHLLAGRDDVILCFGSLSYLGRILKLMEKRQTAGNKRKAKR